MKAILFYFIQVVLASGLLYAYYHFFLRNNRFHQYNRFYLLISSALSLILPIFRIDIYFTSQQDIPVMYQLLADVKVGKTGHSNALPFPGWKEIVQLVYLFIALLFFARLFISLLKILRLKARHHTQKLEKISLINTQEEGTPFSFFRWLFWNEKVGMESPAGKTLFRHELYHIRQRHSWDIIYLEVLTTIFWINPFFHLIKKEQKATHEFLADQFALHTTDKLEYAELLLMQALNTQQRLVNPFFHNQIKRRIAMITNSSKSTYQYLRKVMVLPVTFFIITVIAVNCTSKDVTQENNDKIFDKVEVEADFSGGHPGWTSFLQKNVNPNVPVDNGAPEGKYTVLVQFVVDKNGKISDLKTLTHFGYGMEEEALRVMKLSPNWSPARQDGQPVNSYRKQPITFDISAE